MSATQHYLVTIVDGKGERAVFWVTSGSPEQAGKRAKAIHGAAGEVIDCRTLSKSTKFLNPNSALAGSRDLTGL